MIYNILMYAMYCTTHCGWCMMLLLSCCVVLYHAAVFPFIVLLVVLSFVYN